MIDLKQAAMLFAALSQESRLRIYKTVADAGHTGLSAGVIALCNEMKPSSTSFHLKELSRAQLLRRTQEGRNVIYAVESGPLYEMVALLERCAQTPAELSFPMAEAGC